MHIILLNKRVKFNSLNVNDSTLSRNQDSSGGLMTLVKDGNFLFFSDNKILRFKSGYKKLTGTLVAILITFPFL